MKSKIFIFKFYAIGNGGMECYTTYKAYLTDIKKENKPDQLEYIIEDVLGGNFPQGVRRICCDRVRRPSKKLLDKINEDLKDDVDSLLDQLAEKNRIMRNFVGEGLTKLVKTLLNKNYDKSRTSRKR